LKDIWDELPNLEFTNRSIDQKSGLRMYEICGRKFQETAKINYVLECLQKIMKGYGKRVRQAEKNEFVDWKSVSHAIRAACQVRELLVDGTITFPLKNAETLKDIKMGKHDYQTFVAPMLERIMAEVEELSKNSDLPETVDRDFWDGFIVGVMEQACC
jgi:hypothetical protein